MISTNEIIPSGQLQQRVNNETITHTLPDYFINKKVVIFAVPGAFTPTCSNSHLPGFVALADKIKAKGIDEIICLSVNDVFVMDAWGKAQNAEHISMMADGDGSYVRALGLGKETGAFGGYRATRFAMIVDHGKVVHLAVEKPGEFAVSDAESILQTL
ncbi:peroxiredoxin [Thalassotalea sediminis]|uniref:peroxiredoxin n=1 Tax=Thalassotalea sediminis TaxID=1759089 RepID=UPI0025736DBF|nr:peroxiredoxin [Thalassotalea sediminis]